VKIYVTILMLIISSIAVAVEKTYSLDIFKGFSYQNEAINPKCVDHLKTWLSESATIITKSIIIDSCQYSNLAFKGRDYSISENGTVSYYEDPEDAHSYFGYRVIGRALNNVFALYHVGYIGLYSLKEQDIIFDFSKNDAKSVKVLTKLSEAYIPCFKSANIRGNKLVIVKKVWDASAPRASQCTDVSETISFSIHNF